MNISVCSWIRNIYILYSTSVWKRKDTSSTPIKGSLCSFVLLRGGFSEEDQQRYTRLKELSEMEMNDEVAVSIICLTVFLIVAGIFVNAYIRAFRLDENRRDKI